jgi:hypothetical protein
MDDSKVRELVGRYRPVEPSSDLRERALSVAAKSSRTWPWAAAAAVLFAVAFGLHAAADRSIASVAMPVAPVSVDELTEAMGGTDEARRAAELIVEERKFREWPSGPDTMTRTIENELNRVN